MRRGRPGPPGDSRRGSAANLDAAWIELDAKGLLERTAGRRLSLLTWPEWADRLNRYLERLHALVWPDLIVIGGGVSPKWDRFAHHLRCPTPVIPAHLRNAAGMIGAATQAATTPQPAETLAPSEELTVSG